MSRPLAMTIAILEPFANDTNTKDDTPVPVTMGSIRQLLTAAKLSEARGRVCEAAKELVGSPVARGATPVKATIKADAVRAALAALAAAEKGAAEGGG